MKYIEAPKNESFKTPTVFLAGGITGCPNWQKDLVVKILDLPEGTIFNPRRDQWPDDPKAISEQITWEYMHLWNSEVVSFWFCKETLCPITLFELGAHLIRAQLGQAKVFIGVEPGYQRAFDIRVQRDLASPTTPIVHSLDELGDLLRTELKARQFRSIRNEVKRYEAEEATLQEMIKEIRKKKYAVQEQCTHMDEFGRVCGQCGLEM